MNSLTTRELQPTSFSPLLSTTALALILTACGGGGSGGSSAPTTFNVSGRLYDGPISGAKIYIDIDDNGKIDENIDLLISTTDRQGSYARTDIPIAHKDKKLIADLTDAIDQGDDLTDDSDNVTLTSGIWLAPSESKVISSLTHYIVMNGDISVLPNLTADQIKTRDPFDGQPNDDIDNRIKTLAKIVADELGETANFDQADILNIATLQNSITGEITSANTAPTAIMLSRPSHNVDETIAGQTTQKTFLATVTLVDDDGLGVNTVELSGTNAGLFELEPSDDNRIEWQLYLKQGQTLDRESAINKPVTLRGTGDGNNPVDRDIAFRLDIDNVDEPAMLTIGGNAPAIAAGTDDGTPYGERFTRRHIDLVDVDTDFAPDYKPTLLLDGQTTDAFILKRITSNIDHTTRYGLYIAPSIALEARAYNFTFKHAGAPDAKLSITPINTDPGGTVTIAFTDNTNNADGTVNAGDTVTVTNNLTDANGIGTMFTYTFYKANASDGERANNTTLHTETTTATTATYTIPDTITAQNTQKIRVEVSYTDDGNTEQTVSAFTARAIGDSYNPFIDLGTFAKATTAHSELSNLQTSGGITFFTIDENTDLSSANANQRKINAPLTSETGVTYSVVIRDKDDALLNDNNHPFDFNNGILSFESTDAFDFETHPIYKITITLMKSNHADTPVTFEVRVNDRDEAPTAMDLVETNGSNPRNEGTTTEQKLADVTFEDEDEEDNFLQNAATIPTSQIFQIKNGNELWLRAGFDLDYETAQSHDITVTLTRTGTSNLTHDFTLNVTDTNDEDHHLTLGGNAGDLRTGTVPINTDTGLTFTFRDADNTIDESLFSINSSDFKVVAANSNAIKDGRLYKIQTSAEKTFTATAINLTVTYNDSVRPIKTVTFAEFTPTAAITTPDIAGGATATYTIDEDDPKDADNDNNPLNNNARDDILVATLSADGGAIAWSIIRTSETTGGIDRAHFKIHGTTGQLYFIGTSNRDLDDPDYRDPNDPNDSDDEYTVIVTATNTAGSDTQTITLTIEDINDEIPELTKIGTTSTLIAGADTNDRDTGLTFTVTDADKEFDHDGFTITGDQNSKFDIEHVSTDGTGTSATYKIIAKATQDITPTDITLTIGYNDGENIVANADRISYTFTPTIPAALDETATATAETFTGSPYNDNDHVSYENSDLLVAIELTSIPQTSLGYAFQDRLISIEHITGSSENDVLQGNAKDNILKGLAGTDSISGLAGNDTLIGGDGIDNLHGGAGDDILEGGAGGDTINGGDGNDTVSYEHATSTVIIDINNSGGALGQAQGDTYVSIEHAIGSSAGDTIYGNDENNILDGRDGNDFFLGYAGDDIFIGGNGIEKFQGGLGNDIYVLGARGEGRDFVQDFIHTVGNLDKIRVDTADGDETTIAALKTAANLRITNDTEINDHADITSNPDTNDENTNDTIIYDTNGNNNAGDDEILMVLLDFTETLTIDMFDII